MSVTELEQIALCTLYTWIASVVILSLVYVSARVASMGWYKSKLEHLKRVMAVTKGDD